MNSKMKAVAWLSKIYYFAVRASGKQDHSQK